MLPDLTEVRAASGPVVPLTVQVAGRWQNASTDAATGSATFDTKSSFNSAPGSKQVDLDVDPNSMPRLDVSGHVAVDGVPQAGDRSFFVVANDANNSPVLYRQIIATVDNDTGAVLLCEPGHPPRA